MKFEYLEIRPCIELRNSEGDKSIQSFGSYEEFETWRSENAKDIIMHVNDHGNVTIYNCKLVPDLQEIWACV